MFREEVFKVPRRVSSSQTRMCAPVRPKEAQLAQLENEAAQVQLRGGEAALRLESLGRRLRGLRRENALRHQLLSRAEAELHRGAAAIARKQAAITVYNKKIEQMVFSTGVSIAGSLMKNWAVKKAGWRQ